MNKTKNKTRQKYKNINTSNTQSLVQYHQKQYLPQWSRHSVARDKKSARRRLAILSFVVLL